jgi:hypothetical protein
MEDECHPETTEIEANLIYTHLRGRSVRTVRGGIRIPISNGGKDIGILMRRQSGEDPNGEFPRQRVGIQQVSQPRV